MVKPEETAREQVDRQLEAAGWVVQDISQLNLSAAPGVAVRQLSSQGGPADDVLFAQGKALGIVEAKKVGTTLSAVAEQSQRYTFARKWIPQRWVDPLPFTYESTGIEMNFRLDLVLAFHRLEHLGDRKISAITGLTESLAEIEARTTAIDHLEAELDRQITRSSRLRQSILAAAFRGS